MIGRRLPARQSSPTWSRSEPAAQGVIACARRFTSIGTSMGVGRSREGGTRCCTFVSALTVRVSADDRGQHEAMRMLHGADRAKAWRPGCLLGQYTGSRCGFASIRSSPWRRLAQRAAAESLLQFSFARRRSRGQTYAWASGAGFNVRRRPRRQPGETRVMWFQHSRTAHGTSGPEIPGSAPSRHG